MTEEVVIVGAKRTPIGSFHGSLSRFKASELGSLAIKAALDQANIDHELIEEILFGCVLPAGMGQGPARQAALLSGLPHSIPATTINKVCGSGMKTLMMAYDQIHTGLNNVMLVGGMESMTNAPYLLERARTGYRFGHQRVVDHILQDGLEDAYQKGQSMGIFAEETAEACGIKREEQDMYAQESLDRAHWAQKDGWFKREIVPVSLPNGKSEGALMVHDEPPLKSNRDKIPLLKSVFKENGTITAANSSSLADGAAALVLMSASKAKSLKLKPLAYVRGHATYALEPSKFTLAPSFAVEALCQKTAWSLDEVDLFEINEAFAVVTMAAMQNLRISHDRVNVAGGACSLGHPLGATGARLAMTLLYALKQRKLKKGIATLCIGGGEGTALAIELP